MTSKVEPSSNTVSKPFVVVPKRESKQLKFILGTTDTKVAVTDRFVKG